MINGTQCQKVEEDLISLMFVKEGYKEFNELSKRNRKRNGRGKQDEGDGQTDREMEGEMEGGME